MIDKSTLNLIRKKNKTIHFNITNRCNVKCRHCINTCSETVLGEAEESWVLSCLTKVTELGYRRINIVGGEPFLRREFLKRIVDKANELGISSSITTNAYWADTVDNAENTLSELGNVKRILISTDFFHLENIPLENIKNAVTACRKESIFMLPGVANIVVSSDLYHLEFVSEETVRNVVDICQKHNIGVSIHAVCANKTDAEKVKKIYKELSKRILVNTSALMPIGAAKTLNIDRFVLRDRIDKFSRFCSAGNIYVDINGNVYGCCNACLAQGSFFFYGNILEISLGEMAEMIEKDSMFQYITKCGPRGLKGILMNQDNYDVFLNREYTCECDACVDILRNIKI